MARGVDYVDFIFVAVGVGVVDGAVFAEDGYAALAFDGVGVHNEAFDAAGELVELLGAEHSGLVE